jgi:hypothetical protein
MGAAEGLQDDDDEETDDDEEDDEIHARIGSRLAKERLLSKGKYFRCAAVVLQCCAFVT